MSRKLKSSSLTLNQRVLLLLGLFLVSMLVLETTNIFMEKEINKKVVFPNFESQVLNGHKGALKELVEAEAQILALRVKSAKTREEQVAIVTAETDPIRFFDDHSGYYFTYDLSGARINGVLAADVRKWDMDGGLGLRRDIVPSSKPLSPQAERADGSARAAG
jgi:hypothetical protein